MSSPLAAILAVRISEYVRAKYGQRLDGTHWDSREQLRFLDAEARIMFRAHNEAISDPTREAAIEDAAEILWPGPEGPSAVVLDLDAYRERRHNYGRGKGRR